jgi:hypothetical protein
MREQRAIFPPSAYALATSDWYFNFNDHRSPHDSWLETMIMSEPASGERQQHRQVALTIRLLGAYHDGYIELRYPRVFSYALNLFDGERGHWDWRYDELRLSDQGRLIHEIEWCGLKETATWLIEASDMEFSWIPRATNPSTDQVSESR